MYERTQRNPESPCFEPNEGLRRIFDGQYQNVMRVSKEWQAEESKRVAALAGPRYIGPFFPERSGK